MDQNNVDERMASLRTERTEIQGRIMTGREMPYDRRRLKAITKDIAELEQSATPKPVRREDG